MLPVKRTMQISLVVLVCISGILLGLSQNNMQLMNIACFGALLGFILVDYFAIFHLKGWIANVASIAILIYSMQDFFEGNGAAKLISVSNLLVYLQTVLMFQEKTVRLNWQVMVLSLLQAVVAAIFNLNFEGGLLFIAYFAVAGLTMILQATLSENDSLEKSNRKSANRLRKHLLGRTSPINFPDDHVSASTRQNPVAIFDATPVANGVLGKMIRHLAIWMAVGMIFTTLIFYSVPRGEQAWFGPKFRAMARTGFSKQVDLNEDGLIIQSAELVMRMWFQMPNSKARTRVSGPIYIRGMALSNLMIKDGKTTWTAPYDRINNSVYEGTKIDRSPGARIRQFITLEATEDPLIYAAMPAYNDRTPETIEFCHEISALTRVRSSDQIEFSPYSYQFGTKINSSNQLLTAWPYVSEVSRFPLLAMTRNKGQWDWLTHLERERYPELVETADVIARLHRASANSNPRELFRKFENYLLDPSRYQYTLDYRNVIRDPNIDPIEDFFANHKSGHCELFASALTLMLRSQNIPARLVVGFHSGEFSEVSDCYMIRKNHAHAWVEAYLPPEQCDPAMRASGEAGPAGAWVILDATPAVDARASASESTIELARTLWQDYVLGLDKDTQPKDVLSSTTKQMLGLFDLSNWSNSLDNATTQVSGKPLLQAGLIGTVLLAIFFGIYRNYRTRKKPRKEIRTKARKSSAFRKFVGSALGLISPNLEKWLLGESRGEITAAFYRKLSRMLAKSGLQRQSNQTQREFAAQVGQHFYNHPEASNIAAVVNEVTELYYRVRFGNTRLDKNRIREIEKELTILEKQIASSA